jgi:hypothetical protein
MTDDQEDSQFTVITIGQQYIGILLVEDAGADAAS